MSRYLEFEKKMSVKPQEKRSIYHKYNWMPVLRWWTWSVSLQLSQFMFILFSTCTRCWCVLYMKPMFKLASNLKTIHKHIQNSNRTSLKMHIYSGKYRSSEKKIVRISVKLHMLEERACKLKSINIADVGNIAIYINTIYGLRSEIFNIYLIEILLQLKRNFVYYHCILRKQWLEFKFKVTNVLILGCDAYLCFEYDSILVDSKYMWQIRLLLNYWIEINLPLNRFNEENRIDLVWLNSFSMHKWDKYAFEHSL